MQEPEEVDFSPALKSDIAVVFSVVIFFAFVFVFPVTGLYKHPQDTPVGLVLSTINFAILLPATTGVFVLGLFLRKSEFVIFLKYVMVFFQCLIIIVFFLFYSESMPKESAGLNDAFMERATFFLLV